MTQLRGCGRHSPLDNILILSSFRELTVQKYVKKEPGLIESKMFLLRRFSHRYLI